MIKLVIFDMDGLLIDSERAMWLPNEIKVLNEMGYEAHPEFLRTLMGGAKKTNYPKYKAQFGEDFDVEKFYELLYAKNQYYIDNGLVPLKDGALELFDYLKKNNISVCLGTSSPIDYTRKVLTSNRVLDKFDRLVTRDDVVTPKPAPDIYNKCASLFPYDKSEMLVLEDAHNGSLAAYEAGIRCIIVPDMGILYDWDKEHCTIVNNLKDVIDIIESENNA